MDAAPASKACARAEMAISRGFMTLITMQIAKTEMTQRAACTTVLRVSQLTARILSGNGAC